MEIKLFKPNRLVRSITQQIGQKLLVFILSLIDILREDLSLSIKSAEHKTQLLVGQKICQQPPESIGSWAFWKKDNQQLGM